MRAQPLVTVCMPTIGRTPLLYEALKSLEAQSYSHYEALILDNASPPDAQEVLRGFAEMDARVRILRSDQQLPMFANFNRGIRDANGEFVVFFHDDDLYLPRLIETQLDMLRRHPSAGFAASNYYLIDQAGGVIRRRGLIARTEVLPGRRFIGDVVQRGRSRIATPGIMYRREVLEAYGFDEALPILFGDYVVLMRQAETCDVALIAEPLMHIRVHAAQGSGALPLSRAIPLRTAVLRDYCAGYAERWPDDTAFVRGLERGLERSRRLELLWGWVSAPDEGESEACLRELCGSQADARLAGLLRRLNRLGLSPGGRRTFFTPLLRRLGRAAGI